MSWRRVEGNPREIKGIDETTGKVIAVIDLQVATAADLPELGGEVENYIVAAGSMAQIVEADAPTFVTLSGDTPGWYPEQSDTSASTLSAPKLTKTASVEAPEPEVTEDES